jgi:hypothetical protein
MHITFNYLQALIGSVNEDYIDTVLKTDAKLNSCDAKLYVNENKVGYLTVISTWSALIQSPAERVLLLDTVKQHGLLKTIKFAKQADLSVLNSELPSSDNPLTALVVRLLTTYQAAERGMALPYSELLKTHLYLKRLHQILVYPLRYTPVYAPFLDNSTWDSFKSGQRNLRAHDAKKKDDRYRGGSGYLRFSRLIRRKIERSLPWNKICNKIEQLLVNPKLYLSKGSCAKVGKYKGNKIVHLVEHYPELGFSVFGHNVDLLSDPEGFDTISTGYVVPKNSSTKRFIAAEDVYRQMICLGVFHILDPYLEHLGIKLHDQSVQRNLCYEASKTGEYATTDVSAASDGITHVNFADLFPTRFVALVSPYLPTSVEIQINGKKQTYDLVSRMTMGNAITFACECLIFWAADSVAYDEYELFTGEKLKRYHLSYATSSILPLPGVYGDDQIHHSCVSELVYEILDFIGFNVNRDKSYSGSHLYRESCGVEWYGELDITPCRYPRKAVAGTWKDKDIKLSNAAHRDSRNDTFYDSTMTLISLQKGLIEHGLTEAADIVTAIVLLAEPRMTFSSIGEDCCDLWGYTLTQKEFTERAWAITSPCKVLGMASSVTLYHYLTRQELKDVQILCKRVDGLQEQEKGCRTFVYEKEDKAAFEYLSHATGFEPIEFRVTVYEEVPLTSMPDVKTDPTAKTTTTIEKEVVVDRYFTVILDKPIMYTADKRVRVLDQHLTPTVKFNLSKDRLQDMQRDTLLNARLDVWRYLYFLQFGPTYEHDPDSIEGIMERLYSLTSDPWKRGNSKVPPTSYFEQLFGAPEISWELKADI